MDGLTKDRALRNYEDALSNRRMACETAERVKREFEEKKQHLDAVAKCAAAAEQAVMRTLDVLNVLLGEPVPGRYCAGCDSHRCGCAWRYR